MPPSNMEEIDFFTKRSPEELIDILPNRIREAIRSGERGRKAERNLALLRSLIFESSLVHDVSAAGDFADELLSRLTCPVRCIYGDRSSCLGAGRRLSRVLPNCELVILHGGHYLPAESSAELTESLREFLNG
jgi:pimeloyl-ACP methyl ester carboxylesterase